MSHPNRYSKAELTTMVEMLANNQSETEIAEAINRSEAAVRVKTSRIKKVIGRASVRARPIRMKIDLGGLSYNTISVQAQASNMPVEQFVAKLLTIIAK